MGYCPRLEGPRLEGFREMRTLRDSLPIADPAMRTFVATFFQGFRDLRAA
jgi:hypothetical protein